MDPRTRNAWVALPRQRTRQVAATRSAKPYSSRSVRNPLCISSTLTGWKIGDADPKDDAFDEKDAARIDKRDRELLYQTLEKAVLPAFGNRAKWIEIMRASIAMSEGSPRIA